MRQAGLFAFLFISDSPLTKRRVALCCSCGDTRPQSDTDAPEATLSEHISQALNDRLAVRNRLVF